MKLARIVAVAVLACSTSSHAAPDEKDLGSGMNYPAGTRENWFRDEHVRVGSFSNLDKIFPFRSVPRPLRASALPRANDAPPIQYSYGGRTYAIDDFLERQRITGLLIIRDGHILVERYQYARMPEQRFLSFSIAKSITSLAIGAALGDGSIKSLDDRISTYIPELAGYPYGDVSIRNVLRMASGVKFVETYQPDDDPARFISLWEKSNMVDALKAFRQTGAPPGTRFDYASSNSNLLGMVVARATRKTLSEYVEEKIWKPMGAESDAGFGIANDGNEYAGTRFIAVLRDYGRLGVLLANDGKVNGRQIIPHEYLQQATDASRQPEAFAPGKATPVFGYGYHFWLLPDKQFVLNGVYGQAIYVDPSTKTVMVHTGVAKDANIFAGSSMGAESLALWKGLTRAGQSESAAADARVPDEVQKLLAAARDTFVNSDRAGYAALYHPDFLHSGRNKESQVQFIVSQAMGRLKQWDTQVKEFRPNGDKAYLKGVIVTEFAEYPLDTQLIRENGRWYFYGNQQ